MKPVQNVAKKNNAAQMALSFPRPTFVSSAIATSFSILSFSLLALGLGACSSNPETTDSATMESLDSTQTDTSVSPELLGESESSGTAAGTTSDFQDNANPSTDRFFGQRRAPVISEKPFEKEGRWMNAYYFVRSQNETWESISTLIYGRPDRASLLMSWNVKDAEPLKAGKVIYYNSALRPDDIENIKVFSDDFGLAFEQVEVKAGDSMSLIGLNMFGDAQVWREIASLNPEIANPDVIQPGQKLKIQSVTLNTKAVFEQLLAQAQAQSQEQQETPAPIAQNNQLTQNSEITNVAAESTQTQGAEIVPDTIETTNSAGSDKMGILIKVIVSIILVILIGIVLKRRVAAKKALNQSWENQASVMTKISG
jgi:hypothetical protein